MADLEALRKRARALKAKQVTDQGVNGRVPSLEALRERARALKAGEDASGKAPSPGVGEQQRPLLQRIEKSKPIQALESLALGTSQDLFDLTTGAAHILGSLASFTGRPKLGEALKGVKLPQVKEGVEYPGLFEAGKLLDPAVFAAPMAKLKGLGKLAGPASSALTGGALGGLYGAAKSPEDFMKGLTGGAALGGIMGAASPVAGKVISELGFDPLKRAASPVLKRQASDIANSLKGGSSAETVSDSVFNLQKEHYADLNEMAARKYGELNEHIPADFKFEKKLYDESIDKELGKINKSLEQYAETKLLKKDKQELSNTLKEYKNVRIDSFADADLLKRDINNRIADVEPGKPIRSSLHNIKQGLRSSVKDSAGATADLKEKWEEADQFYRENIVPFERMEGEKKATPFFDYYLKGKGTTEAISPQHIKASKKDETKLLKQYLKMAPNQEARDLIAYDYLKGAEDNPQEIINRYSKLGKNQRKLLFPKHWKQLDNLEKLNQRMPGILRESKEGLRTLEKLGTAASYGLAGSLAVGVSPLTGLAALLGPKFAEEGAGWLMEVPAIRNLILSGGIGDVAKLAALKGGVQYGKDFF